jgi:hypothetical protein
MRTSGAMALKSQDDHAAAGVGAEAARVTGFAAPGFLQVDPGTENCPPPSKYWIV